MGGGSVRPNLTPAQPFQPPPQPTLNMRTRKFNLASCCAAWKIWCTAVCVLPVPALRVEERGGSDAAFASTRHLSPLTTRSRS